MLQERRVAIVEDLAESETLGELKALWCWGQASGNEYSDCRFTETFKEAAHRLKANQLQPPDQPGQGVVAEPEEVPMSVETDAAARIRQLEAEVAELRAREERVVVRGKTKYVLMKTDVSWTTVPQIHAIMSILQAHAKVGDVLDNADIVEMMEQNRAILSNTRQTGERIWSYYKGSHARGLEAHGNIKKL